VKFKNILKLTSNFNSHIIKKTFGLIYSFSRKIDWVNLQSYSFIKITRNIFSLKEKFEFIVVIFCYCRGWQSWFILFFSKENCCKFHHYFVLSFEWSSLERPLKKNTDLFEKLSQSMSSSSHIRCVLNLEIVVELCLLFFSAVNYQSLF